MQVRIFESADMTSGLKMIKKELGPDALILSTRTIRRGKMGILGKPLLEITAAVDADFPGPQTGVKQQPAAGNTHPPASPAHLQSTRFSCVADEGVAKYLAQGTASAADDVDGSSPATKGIEAPGLQTEVNELKALVKNLAGQINRLADRNPDSPGQSPVPSVKDTAFASRIKTSPVHRDPILSMLTDRGINADTSRTIAGFVRETLTEEEQVNIENVNELIRSTIRDLINTAPPGFQSSEGQHRLALIGPTGVGKTTTLAKIAAAYLGNYSGSIALITIDTYRIAAVEQLKVYGEIMHLPVEVVIAPEQLDQAIDKYRDRDLILIDTAGRSPKDNFSIEELAAFLKPDLNIEKHLVLSATTRENELLDIIDRFSALNVDNAIITKIDECTNLGVLLNMQIKNPTPFSYITNGQRVPEDLLEVDPDIVTELIMSHRQGGLHE
ncbi:MAG: flagellar biosynthesis protein FlhF [Desulforhopalus sp.]